MSKTLNLTILFFSLVLLVLLVFFTQNFTGEKPAERIFFKGIVYNTEKTNSLDPNVSDTSLERLTKTNADSISIRVVNFQDAMNSTEIYQDNEYGKVVYTDKFEVGTPTDSQLVHCIKKAHELNLSVALKMDIQAQDNFRKETWGANDRVYLAPSNWTEWFGNYRKVVRHYAEIAEENEVEIFIIGSELESSTKYVAEWRRIINEVRSIYHGKLTYSAHLDYYDKIKWWNDLDFVGINANLRLTNKTNPTLEEMHAAMQKYKDEFKKFYDKTKKSIIFTEIAVYSGDGVNMDSGNWVKMFNATPDLQEQADYYEAFFRTFYNTTWIRGMYFWDWEPGVENDAFVNTSSFSFVNKPAEYLIKDWYGE